MSQLNSIPLIREVILIIQKNRIKETFRQAHVGGYCFDPRLNSNYKRAHISKEFWKLSYFWYIYYIWDFYSTSLTISVFTNIIKSAMLASIFESKTGMWTTVHIGALLLHFKPRHMCGDLKFHHEKISRRVTPLPWFYFFLPFLLVLWNIWPTFLCRTSMLAALGFGPASTYWHPTGKYNHFWFY